MLCVLVVNLHDNSKHLKTGFKVEVFENDAIIVSV